MDNFLGCLIKKGALCLSSGMFKKTHLAQPGNTEARMTDAKTNSTPAKKRPSRPGGVCPSVLSYALSTVAADVYMQLDAWIFSTCVPMTVKPNKKRKRTSPGEGDEGLYATWKPKGSLFFTLAKASSGSTVVYCHANGTSYLAAPAVRLAADCPEKTCFLCQWCMDRPNAAAKQGGVPRMLVFDVLEAKPCPNVAERGERLRWLARFLPQPMCVLQWAGQPAALTGFVKSLPHPVECIISLSEDPHRIYRHMCVDIPVRDMGPAVLIRE